MAIVPNGRMRMQEKQSLLRNGLFSFAQAQQNAQQTPKTDPRVEIEQQEIGNNGQQPAADQSQQAAPAPVSENPQGDTPPANTDVIQNRVDNSAENAMSQDASPQPGKQLSEQTKNSLTNFIKDLVTKVMGVPPRKLEAMGGFTQWSSDAQHNDTVSLKFPNWYYGRPELGEVSKEHRVKIQQEIQNNFNMFFDGASGDDDNLVMKFTSVDPRMGQETEHDVRLRRTYKMHAKPGGGAGAAKAASTLGEMIKDRRNDLFDAMRKIAQGSK